jgi:hypothetical protein
MLLREKERKQLARWERMQKRGHVLYVALHISTWVGSYAFVRLMHVLCFQLGWMQSPGTTSWEDVLIWTVTGTVVGELDWSDMKRKFRTPPPEEDWMAK